MALVYYIYNLFVISSAIYLIKRISNKANSRDSTMIMDFETNPIEENFDKVQAQEAQNEVKAEELKAEGNILFANKRYILAIAKYAKAIDLCPKNHILYGNRAAALMAECKYRDALTDAKKAVSLCPTYTRGTQRILRCYVLLGDLSMANSTYSILFKQDPEMAKQEADNIALLNSSMRELNNAVVKEDYRAVVYYAKCASQVAPGCAMFRIQMAEAMAHLHRIKEAEGMINDIIRMDPQNAEAIYVRGVVLYYSELLDKASVMFTEALKRHPEHTKSLNALRVVRKLLKLKEDGKKLLNEGNLTKALDTYEEALLVDKNNKMVNARLQFNKALVVSRMGQLEKAVEFCSKAIELDSKYVKAYLKRADVYKNLGKFEESVHDYEWIYSQDKSRHNRMLLDEAKLTLAKSKRKDYYKILGVTKTANEDEIKKAFRRKAMLHHPDKHSSATAEVKLEEERKFKDVNEAYSVLTDKRKKNAYDCGKDIDDHHGPSGYDQYDPAETLFQYYNPNGFFRFNGM